VHDLIDETPRAKTIVLDVAGWPGHIAGQHVDVRLTAEDGYQTERSYSIASAPEHPNLALTVERIEGGEVSPYLTEELHVGDQLELRGPMGGFTWRDSDGGPLLLIAGGQRRDCLTSHGYVRPAAGLDGIRSTRRCRDAAGGWARPSATTASLRLRPDIVCRPSDQRTHRDRPRRGHDPSRGLRTAGG